MKNKISFIDLPTQQKRIRKNVEARMSKILDHGNYIAGPEITELEEKISTYCGCDFSVGCGSGTDALIIALLAMGVKRNDVVFLPAFTFIASASSVLMVGAVPIFVDVDEKTALMCSEDLEHKISMVKKEGKYNPKIIMAVDLYGICCDYDAIKKIAMKEGLSLLADAAQSFGGEYDGKKVGSITDISATSFFPGKAVGAYGDAGAVMGFDKDNINEICQSIRWHGTDQSKYNAIRQGFNGRIDSFQAAILIEKLSIFPDELENRQKIAAYYDKNITNHMIEKLTFPQKSKSGYGYFTIKVKNNRDGLKKYLLDHDVPCTIYYALPLHHMSLFKDFKADLPNTDKLSNEVLSIPMHPYLEDDQLAYICETINNFKDD